MNEQDKQMLLKDLSARLPYWVICSELRHGNSRITEVDIVNETVYCDDFDEYVSIEKCRPYLRSMNDMTEEEWADYQKIRMIDWVNGDINGTFINAGLIVDWLNKNYFDYHRSYDTEDGRWKTMIEKGLAIAVTKENNPYIKEKL